MASERLKILGISCDASQGVTLRMVQLALEAAEQFGRQLKDKIEVVTHLIDAAPLQINPCLNCDRRYEVPALYKDPQEREEGWCIIEDDEMLDVFDELEKADGLIIGSPIQRGAYSSLFRLVWERFSYAIFRPNFTFLPTATIGVAEHARDGLEIGLQQMNDCVRWVEGIPAAWPRGAAVVAPGNGGEEGEADPYGTALVQLNAQRVVEFATLFRLAKKRLGATFTRECIQFYHPPHGQESWWWK